MKLSREFKEARIPGGSGDGGGEGRGGGGVGEGVEVFGDETIGLATVAEHLDGGAVVVKVEGDGDLTTSGDGLGGANEKV